MTPIPDATMKPYFVRAVYEWCVDKRRSPRLLARADEKTGAPQRLARDGKIVFNISPEAVRGLLINNDGVSFAARFSGGETREIALSMDDILAVFDGEEGRGVFFAPSPAQAKESPPKPQPQQEPSPPRPKTPNLSVV